MRIDLAHQRSQPRFLKQPLLHFKLSLRARVAPDLDWQRDRKHSRQPNKDVVGGVRVRPVRIKREQEPAVSELIADKPQKFGGENHDLKEEVEQSSPVI